MPGPDPTRAAKRSIETRATISTPTTTTPALFAGVQLDRRRGLRRQAQRVDPVRQSQAGRRGSSPIELRQVGGQHRPHEFPHHELATKTGRSPTVAELAQYLELSIEDVLDGLEAAAAHHSSSLDATHDDDDGDSGTLVDTFGQNDAGLQLAEDATTVATAMRTLPERERRVLQLRFFEDRTQREIAEQIGISQMQISRTLRRAITTLNELTLSETSVADDPAPA